MAKDLTIVPLFDLYGGMLTEKQRDVMDLYYNEDLSLSEIAEHEGITRQGVRDSIKRAEAVLLELEEKLHILGLVQEITALCAENAADCEQLLSGDEKITGYHSVQRVRRMLQRQRDFLDGNIV